MLSHAFQPHAAHRFCSMRDGARDRAWASVVSSSLFLQGLLQHKIWGKRTQNGDSHCESQVYLSPGQWCSLFTTHFTIHSLSWVVDPTLSLLQCIPTSALRVVNISRCGDSQQSDGRTMTFGIRAGPCQAHEDVTCRYLEQFIHANLGSTPVTNAKHRSSALFIFTLLLGHGSLAA